MDAIVGNAVTKEKVEVPETSGTSFGGIAEGRFTIFVGYFLRWEL